MKKSTIHTSHPRHSAKWSAEINRPSKLHCGAFPLIALLSACLLSIPAAHAEELPRKAPLGKYAGLWNNSPFTSRPVVQPREVVPEDNPLDDYALTGVSPVADGFRVTLINRNDPTERIVVNSARESSNHDFKIVNINRSAGRPLSTTVELTDGNFTSTIGFEEALLTLTPPPAATPQQPQTPPGVDPAEGQQEQAQGARRQPRPRVVPPPANGQQGQTPQQQQQQQQQLEQRRAAAQRARAERANQGGGERTDRRGRR